MRLLVVALLALALPLPAATSKRLDERKPEAAPGQRLTVSIDVKDAEAVAILKDLQKQCAVKNLMIDPDVKGKGTFYFREVPCPQAWSIVLRSLGLDGVVYPSSVVTVGASGKR